MYNDKERISANEINRYVYCNYQWYYRRLYGDPALSKLKKEHNKTLGIKKDPRIHALKKGSKFHMRYDWWYKVKKRVYLLLIVTLLIFAIYFLKGIW